MRKAVVHHRIPALTSSISKAPVRCTYAKYVSNQSATLDQHSSTNKDDRESEIKTKSDQESDKTKKSQAQLDEELRQKLESISGDGGEAGLELEGGQPVSMKRGVKNNMFRYI
ncbi:hypothetical protein ACLMJK_003417 [Lecanora helva]